MSLLHIRTITTVALIATAAGIVIHNGVLGKVAAATPGISMPSLHLGQLTGSVSSAIGARREYHFSPSESLEDLDSAALGQATDHLDIAMYAFTDRRLADDVVDAAKRGVTVRIYRDHEQYQQEMGRKDHYVADALASSPNISIRVKGGRDLMHLKEWSDGNILRDGSANWSVGCEHYQDNSISIQQDKAAAALFEYDFQIMWDRDDNIVGQ
jgi:phosphatidylserine/phosphatidylglycerophosphate/cardiolipin synthase-like enzyme